MFELGEHMSHVEITGIPYTSICTEWEIFGTFFKEHIKKTINRKAGQRLPSSSKSSI